MRAPRGQVLRSTALRVSTAACGGRRAGPFVMRARPSGCESTPAALAISRRGVYAVAAAAETAAAAGKHAGKARGGRVGVSAVSTWRQGKRKKPPLTMVTAYDAPGAKLAAEAGIDIILVGDSLGMVVHGKPSTVDVRLDDMVTASASVMRGLASGDRSLRQPLVIGDLPFASYLTATQACESSARLLQEGGVDAVKLEGGFRAVPLVEAIVGAGINVCGHIGLTPQTCGGRFSPVGRSAKRALELVEEARALEAAGCFALVLECVPSEVSLAISEAVSIPTIGIGAGPHTTGQVLVYHDVTGMYPSPPNFSRQFADVRSVSLHALQSYRHSVVTGNFPAPNNFSTLKDDRLAEFRAGLETSLRGKVDDRLQTSTSDQVPLPLSCNEMPPAFQSISVVGGGALGLALASVLQRGSHGARVRVVTRRSDLVGSIGQNGGIVRDDGHGKQEVVPIEVAESLAADTDLVILAHKQTSNAECARAGQIAQQALRNNSGCVVLALQNGEMSPAYFEADSDGSLSRNTFRAVTYLGAALDATQPEKVRLSNFETGATIIQTPSGEQSPDGGNADLARGIAHVFHSSGLAAVIVDDEEEKRSKFWEKLAVNVVVNSLTAICDVDNGVLADSTGSVAPVLDALCAELLEIIHHDIDEPPAPLRNQLELASYIRSVAEATAHNVSSTRADLRQGRRTELDAICGFAARRAAELGVRTPQLDALLAVLRTLLPPSEVAPAEIAVKRGISEIRNLLRTVRRDGRAKVGFIPTMGSLHEGHLDLARQARKECDYVVASIFVNPTQFSASEDLDTYPRSIESDIAKLRDVGVNAVFTPTASELYGDNFISYVVPRGMAVAEDGAGFPTGPGQPRFMPEGQARPHFFRGVATVVAKLFNIVQPHAAYFGEKDAQQCIAIRRLVDDLNFDIELRLVSTRREADGLAMSSRNSYLSLRQRQSAPLLFRALSAGARAVAQQDDGSGGSVSVAGLKSQIESFFSADGESFRLEYVSVADRISGIELDDDATVRTGQCCISAAATMLPGGTGESEVRLIDNVLP